MADTVYDLVLGRVTVEGFILSDLTLDGGTISFSGKFRADTFARTLLIRDALLGYGQHNTDEPIVNFQLGQDPRLNGYVKPVKVTWRTEDASLAADDNPLQILAFELERQPGWQSVTIEETVEGALLDNDVDIEAADIVPWHAVPATARAYTNNTPLERFVRSSEEGDLALYVESGSPPFTDLLEAAPAWKTHPEDFLTGAARIRQGAEPVAETPIGLPWPPALSTPEDLQATVVAIGDSVTEIIDAHPNTRWTYLFQEQARTAYPIPAVTQGIGYLESWYNNGNADGPTTSGNVVHHASGLGLRSLILGPNIGSGAGHVEWTESGAWARVWYVGIGSAGTFTITVDSVVVATVDPENNSFDFHSEFRDVDLGGPGSHTVELDWATTGSGIAPHPIVSGVQFFNGEQPTDAWLELPGADTDYISAPDAAFSLADVEIRYDIEPDDYATAQTIAAKWTAIFIDQRSVLLTLGTDRKVTFRWSTTGADDLAITATVAHPAGRVRGRIRFDANNGAAGRTLTVYESSDHDSALEDVTSWSLIDTVTTATATSIFNSTALFEVGRNTSGFTLPFGGKIRGCVFYSDLSGTIAARAPIGIPVATGLSDGYGNTWQLHGAAARVRTGERGTHVLNSGKSQHFASSFADNPLQVADWVSRSQASLALLALGLNDRAIGFTAAQFKTNMQTIIDAARDGDPNVSIGIIAWYADTRSAAHPWSEYVAVMYELAAENANCIVIDFSNPDEWPQPGTSAGNASGYYSDGTHPSEAGHAAIAFRIIATLVGSAGEFGNELAVWQDVVGVQVPDQPLALEVANALVRLVVIPASVLGHTSGLGFAVGTWTGDQWRWKTFVLNTTNDPTGDSLSDPIGAVVYRNSVERVSVGFVLEETTHHRMITVAVSLSRGSRYVELRCEPDRAWLPSGGIELSGVTWRIDRFPDAEPATDTPGGHVADTGDDNGDRYLILSPQEMTGPGTAGWTDATAPKMLRAAVALELSGAVEPDTVEDLTAQYFAARWHTQQVTAG